MARARRMGRYYLSDASGGTGMKRATLITRTLFALMVIACVPLTFLATNATVYAILDTAPQETDQRVIRTVKAVCDYAHNINDGGSEEACGIAQDASHTIYTCSPSTDICNVTSRGL